MSTIFIRERRKTGEGEKKPRFRVVAVAGSDVRVKVKHIRMTELEAIAQATGAKVVHLEKDGKGKFGKKPE